MEKVVVTIDEFDRISHSVNISDTLDAFKIFNNFMCVHQGLEEEFAHMWGYAALIKYGYTLGVRTERARRKEKANKSAGMEQTAYKMVPVMRMVGGAVKCD